MSNSLYQEWLDAAHNLKVAKAKELKLRNQIIASIPIDKLEGSVTRTEGEYKVGVTYRLNRTIDRTVLEDLWDELPPEERDCIDFKPSLVMSQYKPLEAAGGKILEAITVKPGQASLTIDYIGDEL